jgi:hypothetical protein
MLASVGWLDVQPLAVVSSIERSVIVNLLRGNALDCASTTHLRLANRVSPRIL